MSATLAGPAQHVPDDVQDREQPTGISRRTLLRLGAAAVSGIAAAQLLDGFAPVLGASTGRASAPVGGSDATTALAAPHEWAFACDATKCIGCGRCVAACKLENEVPLEADYTRTWVERHVVAGDGTVYVDSPAAGIHGFPPESTAPGAPTEDVAASYFVPRLCMQCDDPPCVAVCPVGATFKTDGGVVLVDQQRCIGCGYCVVACPYGARYLVPSGGAQPTGTAGVADKCTWCFHRIERGQRPACVEVCPAGARVFGDLLDPESPISDLLRIGDHTVLKPELGTKPRVFYVGLEAEGA
jgi:Fe-S-cluster-containing dehydrogenase component